MGIFREWNKLFFKTKSFFFFNTNYASSHTVGSEYQRTYKDMTWFYQVLLQQDLQLLVYNGDVDMACNFLGGKWFVESLNQQVTLSCLLALAF